MDQLIKKMNNALSTKNEDKIKEVTESMLSKISYLGDAISKHYNTVVYNVDSGNSGVKKYDEKSVVRELFQNIIDCNYSGDLIISVKFNDENREIIFSYNEEGFKLRNIIAFFSLNHTTKNQQQTGAFGIGAKGALLNAKSLSIESVGIDCNRVIKTKFKIKTINQSGMDTLHIDEINIEMIQNKAKLGTNMNISLDDNLYKNIKSNLMNIAGKEKGKYITPIDLVFASLKKPEKEITIIIQDTQKCSSVYINSTDEIQFLYNSEYKNVGDEKKGKGVGFNYFQSEKSKFVYLIYKTRYETEEMPSYISEHKYNLFSTFELVGENATTSGFKFFINIPTLDEKGEAYITYDRTGVEPKKREIVESKIRTDCKDMLDKYSNEFFFYSNKRKSYMLEQFFDVIFNKFSNDVELKKNLCSNTYWILKNNTKIKLSDILFLKNENGITNAICKVSNKYFCCYVDSYGKKSEYSKYMKFYYDFELYYNKANIEGISQYEEWEDKKPKRDSVIDILLEYAHYNTRTEATVYLLELKGVESLTENQLIKLLKVCIHYPKMSFVFDKESKSIVVDEKKYNLSQEFKVCLVETVKKTISFCKDINELSIFREYIIRSFKHTLLENINEPIEKIKKYKTKNELRMSFNDDNHLIISVQYSWDSYFTIDEIELNDLTYEDVVSATGLNNYRLLINNVLDDAFEIEDNVENLYSYDIDKIQSYAEKEMSFSQIFICDSKYNLGDDDLVVVVNNLNKIVKLTKINECEKGTYSGQYLYLLLPKMDSNGKKRRKLSIAEVSRFIDCLFDTQCVYNLYRKIENPSVKFLDQLDYKYKPIFSIGENEINEIDKYLKFHINKKEKAYARDINCKLFGYSTSCPLCSYHSESLNVFLVKEGMKYYEDDKEFRVTFFMCANDYHESDSWLIESIRFKNSEGQYSVKFVEWINKITKEKKLEPYDFKCKISIRKMSSNKLFDFEETLLEQIKEHSFILTSALAVKWYQDNKK